MVTVLQRKALTYLTPARSSPCYYGRIALSTTSRLLTSHDEEMDNVFSKPSWSVKSLLPQSLSSAHDEREVSPEQLSHLLRLSALPQPASEAERNEMLETLQSQIHFVREIQKVDTNDVAPLVALRDESPAGIAENTIGPEDLKEAFAHEKLVGRNGRIKRQKVQKTQEPATETWNALEMASKTAGRYFVVQKSKKEKGATSE